ncbi:MAG: PilN domain-containing protein [Azospira sp.]|jgi:type IV pilus assembly protein PilN|nr:PilN domain-containing protein [Azospira sp.]
MTVRINLLPHREERRKARRQQFFSLSALIAVLAGLIVFLGYSVIAGYISAQEDRNAFLKAEIATLDKQIAEIKRLRQQTDALLARKRIIESLQGDRAEAVHLLNELARQVPEGIYLKSLKQNGRNISISGYTQSNARVSVLMRNLEASPWIERPQLVEIKAVTQGRQRVGEFSLNARMKRPEATVDAAKAGAKPATRAAGAKK